MRSAPTSALRLLRGLRFRIKNPSVALCYAHDIMLSASSTRFYVDADQVCDSEQKFNSVTPTLGVSALQINMPLLADGVALLYC